jgi:amidase
MARLMRASKRKSATEMQEWQWKRDQFVLKFRKEVSPPFRLFISSLQSFETHVAAEQQTFQDNNLDFVLCSTQATPALKHGQTWDLSPLAIGKDSFSRRFSRS